MPRAASASFPIPRPTGNARHLVDPANKIYYATMEQGLYSVHERTLEVDIDGTDLWVPYKTFDLETGETLSHRIPAGFSAYWVRATSDRDTTATAWFIYE